MEATDGINAPLGEYPLVPMPPAGKHECKRFELPGVRFILTGI
jgi:hypothetical protein